MQYSNIIYIITQNISGYFSKIFWDNLNKTNDTIFFHFSCSICFDFLIFVLADSDTTPCQISCCQQWKYSMRSDQSPHLISAWYICYLSPQASYLQSAGYQVRVVHPFSGLSSYFFQCCFFCQHFGFSFDLGATHGCCLNYLK